MKITIELPEHTICGFLGFVYVEGGVSYQMGSVALDTDDLARGEVSAVERIKEIRKRDEVHN